MATDYQLTNMRDLPNELLLQIASHLAPIRSFEPQSEAFKLKEKEKARQCENSRRQNALYSLCLTSRGLKAICEPILYSAFISSTTWNAFGPLKRFLSIITKQPALASHVRYIENRLSDYRGHSLHDDMELFGSVENVTDYFDTLAAVICRAPRLFHLTVVSLETLDVSLWRHLVQDWKDARPRMAAHGFPKLETLCLQMHTDDYGIGNDLSWFQRISNALLLVPTLKDFRASGVTSGWANPVAGTYPSLSTIDISECMVDLEELVRFTRACTALKRFGCHWAYLNSQGFHLPDLYAALLAHKATLEHLRLDKREVRLCADDFPMQPLGSLRDFPALKSVEVCETSLLANEMFLLDFPDQHFPVRLSELLPPSLECLTLCVMSESSYEDDCRIDGAYALWDLVEDCPKMLPNLKKVHIKAAWRICALNLTTHFRDVGVEFSTVLEDGVDALSCDMSTIRDMDG